jgi:hypothetical protein
VKYSDGTHGRLEIPKLQPGSDKTFFLLPVGPLHWPIKKRHPRQSQEQGLNSDKGTKSDIEITPQGDF